MGHISAIPVLKCIEMSPACVYKTLILHSAFGMILTRHRDGWQIKETAAALSSKEDSAEN